jgi:hypothetical protein
MTTLETISFQKVNELSEFSMKSTKTQITFNETLLLVQIQSLQLKNINLELRLQRMEKHLEQIIHHTKFPVSNLAWGQQPLISKLNILIWDMFI